MIKINDEDFILLMLCSGGVAGAMVYCARGCFWLVGSQLLQPAR